jgi:hypothetical protein
VQHRERQARELAEQVDREAQAYIAKQDQEREDLEQAAVAFGIQESKHSFEADTETRRANVLGNFRLEEESRLRREGKEQEVFRAAQDDSRQHALWDARRRQRILDDEKDERERAHAVELGRGQWRGEHKSRAVDLSGEGPLTPSSSGFQSPSPLSSPSPFGGGSVETAGGPLPRDSFVLCLRCFFAFVLSSFPFCLREGE